LTRRASRETTVVRGIELCRDPAREPCFTVVHELHELLDPNVETPEGRRQFVHLDLNNEVQSAEIAAQTLADFPDAPWELRLSLARQAWDEVRHARLYYQHLKELGGYKGEFAVANHEWGVACMIDSLPGRLAIQNRAFEGGSLEVFMKMAATWREQGDDRAAEISEGVLTDELQHVRFANEWLRRMIKENPRTLLEIARAVDLANRIMRALAPVAGEFSLDGVELATRRPHFDMNVEDRAIAGFSEFEIEQLLERDKQKRLDEERQREEHERWLQQQAQADGNGDNYTAR
jgi:uncharacterized ferritin-like protein (DUF455 family)